MDAFTSTTTTTTMKRKNRPAPIMIPASNLRLPVAPPSPFFRGMNTDINTEPFPDFEIDLVLDPVEWEKSLHCVVHCQDSICKRMTGSGSTLPPCRCVLETKVKPIKDTSSGFRRRQVDDSIIEILPPINAHTDPGQELEVYLSDIHQLLAQLKMYTSIRAFHDVQLMSALQNYCPGEVTLIAAETTKCFFDSMREYFDRTLRESGHRTLSIQQLRRELDVYVWTELDEWIRRYCDDIMIDMMAGIDMREYRQFTHEAPGAVSKFWQTCLDDVVGLVVWQDQEVRRFKAEEVRQSKADDAAMWFVIVCMGLYFLAAVVANFLLYF